MSKIRYENKDIDSKYDMKREYQTDMTASKYANVDSSDLTIEIVKTKKNLSIFTKICFASAGLPFQMYFCVISTFVTVFLLEKAKLPPYKSTYILFVSRIVDAITDPIYGFFVNKSKFTKYGKMKPWMMASLPLSIISYVMMWYVPEGWSEDQLFWWFIFWHSFLFTVITGVRIPHTSMTMYLSKNQEDRQSATVYRMGFELIGILLALGIQGPFVIGGENCENTNNKTNNGTTIFNETTIMNTTLPNIETNLFTQEKYVILAIIMSVFFAVGNLLLIFFVEEKNDIAIEDQEHHKGNQPSILTELKNMFTFKPFLILAVSFVFNQLTVQILQANLQLYFEYGYYAIRGLFVSTIIALLALAILFVPLWQFIMNRIGKNKTLIIGNLLLLPLMISSFFFRSNDLSEVIPFYVLVIIASNSFTVSFLVPWAMLPECFDAYFLKYKSRPDALFYTFFILGVKILMAFYLGLSQIVLDFVGFKNGICPESQDPRVSDAIIYLYAPIPFVFALLSSLAILFYPINEKVAEENNRLISQMKDDNKKSIGDNFAQAKRASGETTYI